VLASRILRRRIKRWGIQLTCCIYIPLAGLNAATTAADNSQSPGSQAPHSTAQRALLNQYCVICHNERLKTAGLMLDKVNVQEVGASAEIWEKVLTRVRTGAMPPAGMPRPDRAALNTFTSWLEASLDQAAAVKLNPGRVAIHRLNAAEYSNSVRDLLGLEVDGQALLGADDADEHGFNNIAGVLSVSPALVDRYMSAAHKISRLAVGDPGILPAFETYAVPTRFVQDDRTNEDFPFGSRGGIAVRHYFPVDAEYVLKVRLKRQLYGYIIGLGQPQEFEVRVDGKRIKQFTVGGNGPGKPVPDTYAGNIAGDPQWEEYVRSADAKLEVRLPFKAGTHVMAVSFPRDPWMLEGPLRPPEIDKPLAIDHMYNGDAGLESISIGGPYQVVGPGDGDSRKKIFVCRPMGHTDQKACARQILATLARRAYRRPVTETDVQTLLGFYESAASKNGFDAGIQFALERILADPDFLFRIEPDPADAEPGTVYRLSDLELASRLSFFLWSSIPDDELLKVAISGKLSEPGVLERQVTRMLADKRSNALIDNFGSQWLGLPKLQGMVPDEDVFPDFDENLREAFLKETQIFLESQLREDHGVVDLLSANYTYINERLARHYQIPNIYGNRFRKITFNDGRRGGLLGEGSILMATSYPNRTSPVLRGKWILENILGTPPPPPPPGVPGLKDSGENGKPASVRARLEEHRKNPACAVCHVRMDPLGFALENFDAIGTWRTTSGGTPIDTSSVLPDGTSFQGVSGLRKILLSHDQQFAGALSEKLMTYALGRELQYYDLPVIRQITRDAAAENYRWSSIINGIIKSPEFQMSIVGGKQIKGEQIQAKAKRSNP
jgi:mono/diheme cytochrome c family protein